MLDRDVHPFLHALACPRTRAPLFSADADVLRAVNESLRSAGIELQDVLVTIDLERAYPVERGRPILVPERAIELPEGLLDSRTPRPPAPAGGEKPKLNLGCAHRRLPGHLNVDLDPGSDADVIGDLRSLCFADASVGSIECRHVLEHLAEDAWRGQFDISMAVLEFARVLDAGGRAIIETPSPQGQDAVRGDHLTVYGHKRLAAIFGNYFDEVRVSGTTTWVEARVVRRLFERLCRLDPFWSNAYVFELSRPRAGVRSVVRA
jgi:uncharacterized protein YbaR (Trm112 family)/predicted SAM-dependent methyltransferase